MKKYKFTLLVLIVSFSTINTAPSYAGVESCPSDIVHCAYFSGLSNNLNDGRYIKLVNKNINITVCFNGTSTIFMDEYGAEEYLGKNTDIYSICSDSSGKNCEQIGVDNFVVSKQNGGYIAKPIYFRINMSGIKNKYPACDSLAKHSFKLYKKQG